MTRNPDLLAGGGDPSAETPAAYEFAGFVMDLRRVGVWKGDEAVPLEPKSFDVLRYLVEHRDRLVTHDELLDNAWAGTFVTPNALTRTIARLRKALGDVSTEGTVIETVAKRGYRFVAPVSVIGQSPRVQREPHARTTAHPLGRVLRPTAVLVALLLAATAGAAWWTMSRSSGARHIPRSIAAVTTSGNVIHAALAPGGETVAYVESVGGLQALWLRQIDGANAIPLVAPAPVEYWGVTISPDSRTIYYVVKGAAPHADPSGTLFRLPLLGGAAANLGNGYDSPVAVSPDGRSIAFLRAGHPRAGESAVMIANGDGTGARPIAIRRAPEAFAPAFYAAPSWSPEGDRIAAPLRNVETRQARLALVDTGTGAVSVFAEAFSSVSYTAWHADRGILFAGRALGAEPGTGLSAQIWRQPLPGGAPSRVTSDVIDYRSVSLASDGSALATVGMTNAAGLWLVPLGAGAPRKLPETLRTDGRDGVAWVDAATLTFTSPVGTAQQIWTMNVDGRDRRALTAESTNTWPRPSPDGKTIYFATLAGADEGIWRMRRDGTGKQLVARVRNASRLIVTPDGTTVFFTAPADDTPSTWKVSVDGGAPALVVRGLSGTVVSGDRLQLSGFWRPRAAAATRLAVFPIEGGPPTHVFDGPFGSDHGGSVWWSADGQALLFTTTERANVWRLALSGGAPVRVTDLPDGAIVRGDVSPDGRTLVALRGTPVRDVYLLKGF
jgi:DNA-binding winged helix-turn-helix (wHTH) protein/Tol biopolymer transport system component